MMKEKITKSLLIKTISIFLIVLTLGLGIFSLQKTETANAESFVQQTLEDGRFSMTLTVNARNQTALDLDKRSITTVVGEEIDYYCFKWSELEYLRFRFNSTIKDNPLTFKSYQFLLTNIQTDDLQTSLGVSEPKILYQGNISNNSFSQFDFYYYIDDDANITETATRCTGNDFGLYKFDFVYTYEEDGVDISRSVGDFYIAVLPDDIDSIPVSDIRILYSISSSNKLMNVFNLYLSNDTYRYVNPKYIQWNVVGNDKMNTSYVLTQKIKDENIAYANSSVIWQSLPEDKVTGPNFVFDSNDIEGTWTVYCTIKNTDGSEKLNLSVQNLSTIKQQAKSYLWLILLIVCLVILIAGIIALIIFYKKRDKVW